MVGQDFRFLGSPSVARQRCVLGFDEEEPLISHDLLTIGQLEHELPPPYLRADIFHANSGLFLELPDCGLFERFSVLNTAARCSPVVPARERVIPVHEMKE
jgi:hypothetical protein